MTIKLYIKYLILLFLLNVALIYIGFTLYHYTSESHCVDLCYKDTYFQKVANYTGHGIAHTCYDYCRVD